ncbi:tannase/feruloyl esterase family alpha/beta hydrolase [Marinomonas sp. C2222]|uniref:Tannase/feruloyl esterase family alpha/beta hydrolase n=1 Tax=Marinomonas sargassi TaxID=2984494 RepID=A0ABT2YQ24_9GAMM|nr:tannase/feruloyl esterase family alpha/beta hydrolase [Marinomonas sargassi]MCV2401982.1 tannase/feruloyl esterase family alpha/beta hydrolase [Marinomonas sargassi]
MKALSSSLIVLTCFILALGANFASAQAFDCRLLPAGVPEDVEITTEMRGADKDVRSPYCFVKGTMAQRTSEDKYFYSIQFEIRLPNFWQGRYAYQFNESRYGEVKPALGAVTGLQPYQYAINQGFAVVSSNGGYYAQKSGKLFGSELFSADPEARLDHAYRYVEKVNPVARLIIQRYYQTLIKHSYGIGQSDGGRVAMVMASRYPIMFDGFLVGSPGFNAPKAALQHAWDVQALKQVNKDVRQSLSERDLALVARSVLNQCDALDGMSDDLIFATTACQQAFNLQALACSGDFDRYCLSQDKISALTKMHQGPRNSKGQVLYTDWLYDTGIRSKNWRQWKIESEISEWYEKPFGLVLGSTALAHLYTSPSPKLDHDLVSLEEYLLDFDFDKDTPRIYRKSSRFHYSAMEAMSPPDAAKPSLTEFHKNGGKMIVFHGNSDPVFSVKDTIRWYDYLDFNLAGGAKDFVRLYPVPGMPHGQGGTSADQFDMLSPLISWVERKQAPYAVVAAARADNPELTERMVGLTRPLCPYPSYARYQAGHYLQAKSFACVIDQ